MLLTKEESDELKRVLLDFVKRVSGDSSASPAEIAALPEIAWLLANNTIEF